MKVLVATNSYPTKKNPTHQPFIKNIYEGLRDEGLEVELLYNPYFKFFKSDLETGNLFTSVLKTFFLFFSYLPVVIYRARKFDILYSHAPIWPGFLMLAAQKIHGIKHITYVHGSVNHYVNQHSFLYKIARYTMHHCTSVVTNSEYMVRRLEREYDCKSAVITPGFNERVFTYQSAPRPIDLFFAGSTIRRKGIRLLLETIHQNRDYYEKQRLTIKLHFSGGRKEDLIQYADKTGISHLIEFGDRLTEETLAETHKASKVFIFPSSEEPLGLVGIEAIACGAALVGSDSGGIKEYLIDGKNGFLFKDGSVEELQQAIEKALGRFPEFEKNQPDISESVKDFTLSEAMKQTISFFKELS
ncbi:glycosyltransferase family 4 protein [Rhodohalobacter sp. 614A]|uniref:glycosyltransferase family 4 protein n=1 Tax=Rhodohalobacter sp. 614A TaxID=2908649 RepID=UPI001F20151C|nr:glycosyltransferase family 4 protein [Rhodohalobacter sp. 614A]